MDILEDAEVKTLLSNSQLVTKYNEEIDRESAFEILSKKIDKAASIEEQTKKNDTLDKEIAELQKAENKRLSAREKELARLKKAQDRVEKTKSAENDKIWKDLNKAATRKTKDNSLFGVLARGILGVLGMK